MLCVGVDTRAGKKPCRQVNPRHRGSVPVPAEGFSQEIDETWGSKRSLAGTVPSWAWWADILTILRTKWTDRTNARDPFALQPGRHEIARADGEILQRHGVAAGHLVFEATEGAAMAAYVPAADTLTRLCPHGVGIAVDDFGTGYSSLLSLLVCRSVAENRPKLRARVADRCRVGKKLCVRSCR
jgi:hypothetical protein